jgi:sec-independent protein translocase protein TatA
MGRFGLTEILVIGVVLLVLFGRGKVSSLMGEVGKGITAFKRGVKAGNEEIETTASETARDVTPETSDQPKV